MFLILLLFLLSKYFTIGLPAGPLLVECVSSQYLAVLELKKRACVSREKVLLNIFQDFWVCGEFIFLGNCQFLGTMNHWWWPNHVKLGENNTPTSKISDYLTDILYIQCLNSSDLSFTVSFPWFSSKRFIRFITTWVLVSHFIFDQLW